MAVDLHALIYAVTLAVREFGLPHQGPCELMDVKAHAGGHLHTITFTDTRRSPAGPIFQVILDTEEYSTPAAIREHVMRSIESYLANNKA
jgi:hypothetical protein